MVQCGRGTMVPSFLFHGGPPMSRLKLCIISKVCMTKWPGGFPMHTPEGSQGCLGGAWSR